MVTIATRTAQEKVHQAEQALDSAFYKGLDRFAVQYALEVLLDAQAALWLAQH